MNVQYKSNLAIDLAPHMMKQAARLFTKSNDVGVVPAPAYKPAAAFSDLPIYAAIQKPRDLGKVFGVKDPFYRTHDSRLGATTQHAGRTIMNFASYDYLGLNQEAAVAEAAKAAIDGFGTSVSASRLVAGERQMHQDLERELADFYGTDAAIAFVSGYVTNVTTIGCLMGPDDLIIMDDLMHNSAIMGAKLSRATVHTFRHNNLDHLQQVLRENRKGFKNALIVVEGLYSMDGDFPDLPQLVEIKNRFGAWLMVDEAHSLGVLGKTGRGLSEHFGVDPRSVEIWMGTLSKTLASCGGYICGSRDLIDILKYQAPGMVYSVGLSPPATASALAALRLLRAEPQRVHRLQANGQLFLAEAQKAGLDVMTSAGYSVVPVIVSCPVKAVRMTESLLERGINALPILPPAVPARASRLRFFITSKHSPEQIRTTVKIVAEEQAAIGRRQSLAERAALAVVVR